MLPDTATLDVFYGTLPLLLAVTIGIWNNNKRLDDFRSRLTVVRSEIHEGFKDAKDRLGKLVTDLEKGLRLVKN